MNADVRRSHRRLSACIGGSCLDGHFSFVIFEIDIAETLVQAG